MTSNATRASILVRALRAGIARDGEALREVLSEDVRAWTPALSTATLPELVLELDRRDDAFSDTSLEVVPLDVGGDHACAEWTVEMTHTGALTLADDSIVEPTGARVTIHGVTVAEFDGERICSLRQYWDEFDVLEQLGLSARHQAD